MTKKIVLGYGALAGAVIIGSIMLSMSLGGGEESALSALQWIGYLIMIVAFGVIFVGVKRVRDQELGGIIRFRTAFAIGLGITAVASVVYVGIWEVNLAVTDYAFIDQYTASVLAAREADGASAEEMQTLAAEMETMREQYGNPLFRLLITFLEIFPVGLLVSLIAAAVLRNSRVLPAVGGDAASPVA